MMVDSGYKYRKNKGKQGGHIRSHLVSEKFMLLLIKILSNTDSIHMRPLYNMERFISKIDRDYYFKDPSLTALILTVESFINMRIRMSGKPIDVASLITKVNTLLTNEINSEIRDNLVIPTIELSKKDVGTDAFDIDFVYDTIETTLKVYKIIQEKDKLIEISNDIDGGTDDLGELVQKYRNIINRIVEYFHETDNDNDVNEIVHTKDSTFKEELRETYHNVKNPSTVLKTGLQMFNDFLGVGGFMNGKYYMIYANTNSFKSALLMHIAKWIQKYNSDSFVNNPDFKGKIPTVLFVSCENSKQEDLERYYKMKVGCDIGNCNDADDMETKWNQNDTDSIIDISFIHSKARDVSLSKIEVVIDTLSDSGYKVIAVIYDYIELMKPEDDMMRLETREKLGRLSENCLNLAKTRNIPVITAMQMNREGGKILDQTKDSGEQNAILKLNNGYIGESYNIEKSTDFSFFIDLEYNPYTNKKYLLFKKNKCRFSRLGIESFAHEIKSGIVIEDDLFEPEPTSVLSLSYDKDGENAVSTKNTKVGNRGSLDKRPDRGKETTLKKSEPTPVSKENVKEENGRAIVWWMYSKLLELSDVMRTSVNNTTFSSLEEIVDNKYYFDPNDDGVTQM